MIFSKQVKNFYVASRKIVQIRYIGTGTSYPKKNEFIKLIFDYPSVGNISHARKLVVEITHKMIMRINQDVNCAKKCGHIVKYSDYF